MRVMLTGAAGAIGQVAALGLTDRGHDLVCVDLVPEPDGNTHPWLVADLTDPDAVAAVMADQPVDGVVHLAGNPDEAPVVESLLSHAASTALLLQGCADNGVSRFVYASSNHSVGLTDRRGLGGELLTVDTPPRPSNLYGVAKVAAEAALRLYADRHAVDAIACRIGSFGSEPRSVRELATWLSPDDCVRMLDAALTTPAPGFAVLYGISANTRGWWDLEPGRRLGYDPLDDAEEFADRVPASAADDVENAVVGGRFASAPLGVS